MTRILDPHRLAGILLATLGLAAGAAPAAAQAPRLFFEQDGSGSPIVWIEEWGHDTSGWFPLLPALRGGHRLVRYDVRGQGRSEAAPEGDYSPAAHRADLDRVLDAVGSESAHLVATGLGARIAIEEVLARPERVRSVTLIQPRLGFTESEREWWNRLMEAWARVGRPSLGEYSSVFVQRWVGSTYATLHPWVPAFYDLMLRRQAAGPLMESARAWLSAPLPGGIVEPGVPVLVVIGENGRPPDPSLWEIAPRASRLRIPDSRWPVVDAADRTAGAVREFLDAADARESAEGGS